VRGGPRITTSSIKREREISPRLKERGERERERERARERERERADAEVLVSQQAELKPLYSLYFMTVR
jgi:hypothetical protein